MPPALSPKDVTNAFTLNSRWLTAAILHGLKDVENRSEDWKSGWYAVHTGVSKLKDEWAEKHVKDNGKDHPRYNILLQDMKDGLIKKGHIAGMCRFAHTLPVDVCDSEWALGPYCMVIAEWQWLDEPIECKGQLGLWGLTDEVRALIKERSTNKAVGCNGADHRFPPNPLALQTAKDAALQERRVKKRAREQDTHARESAAGKNPWKLSK